MHEELSKTLDIILNLNNACAKKIITQEEINEQKDNLEDYKIIFFEIENILSKIERDNLDSVDDTVEALVQLHLKYSDYIWHIDQMHELVKKMIGNYRNNFKNQNEKFKS